MKTFSPDPLFPNFDPPYCRWHKQARESALQENQEDRKDHDREPMFLSDESKQPGQEPVQEEAPGSIHGRLASHDENLKYVNEITLASV